MIASVICVVFALEWDPSFRTDVPYEVDLAPAKLHAKAFSVFADGKPLPVVTSPGKLPGNVTLRFDVPAGAKALTCESTGGNAAESSVPGAADDPFNGALDAASVAKWTLSGGVSVKAIPEGLLFVTPSR